MYIFGGRGDKHAPRQTERDVYCSKIYYLDVITKTWTCPQVFGEIPPGRRSHSACKLKLNTVINIIFNLYTMLITVVHNGFFYIFGGFNKNLNLHFQDIKRYNPERSSWLTVSPKGISPCARRRQICLVIKDRIFISGGTSPIFKPIVPMRLLDYDFGEEMNYLKDHDDLHILNMSKLFITLSY